MDKERVIRGDREALGVRGVARGWDALNIVLLSIVLNYGPLTTSLTT